MSLNYHKDWVHWLWKFVLQKINGCIRIFGTRPYFGARPLKLETAWRLQVRYESTLLLQVATLRVKYFFISHTWSPLFLHLGLETRLRTYTCIILVQWWLMYSRHFLPSEKQRVLASSNIGIGWVSETWHAWRQLCKNKRIDQNNRIILLRFFSKIVACNSSLLSLYLLLFYSFRPLETPK